MRSDRASPFLMMRFSSLCVPSRRGKRWSKIADEEEEEEEEDDDDDEEDDDDAFAAFVLCRPDDLRVELAPSSSSRDRPSSSGICFLVRPPPALAAPPPSSFSSASASRRFFSMYTATSSIERQTFFARRWGGWNSRIHPPSSLSLSLFLPFFLGEDENEDEDSPCREHCGAASAPPKSSSSSRRARRLDLPKLIMFWEICCS
jgi:hypothetical protein